MVNVGIIGGTGYTAGELLRILLNHPRVNISYVYSTSQAGRPVTEIHQDLLGDTELIFSADVTQEVDVVFLCLGHGNSRKFLDAHSFQGNTRIIDLSTDHRASAKDNPFVYGLPEVYKEEIRQARFIANPGCFATAINLALLPLAARGLLKGDVHINGVTGATGAGRSFSPTTHFVWRENNFSTYKAFEHQHLSEINQCISGFQEEKFGDLCFLPNRGDFSRGIYCTLYTSFQGSVQDALAIFTSTYQDAPFTFVTEQEIGVKQVVNTNKCVLRVQKIGKHLLLTAVLDNLLKGASGQAVQNMNLMLDFPEDLGLKLKANYF